MSLLDIGVEVFDIAAADSGDEVAELTTRSGGSHFHLHIGQALAVTSAPWIEAIIGNEPFLKVQGVSGFGTMVIIGFRPRTSKPVLSVAIIHDRYRVLGVSP